MLSPSRVTCIGRSGIDAPNSGSRRCTGKLPCRRNSRPDSLNIDRSTLARRSRYPSVPPSCEKDTSNNLPCASSKVPSTTGSSVLPDSSAFNVRAPAMSCPPGQRLPSSASSSPLIATRNAAGPGAPIVPLADTSPSSLTIVSSSRASAPEFARCSRLGFCKRHVDSSK